MQSEMLEMLHTQGDQIVRQLKSQSTIGERRLRGSAAEQKNIASLLIRMHHELF
jgi:hypothetical protein